ncbi:uncharacterized protein BYT42DRAFT_587923 [Radiomyces spectabilis]|uniref:uncharacterized protein n=1 Tax=Radiomyces spectabilis TaxID=64574 RepID=UPI002220CCB7|nr:uncharacterized protein BYT42DRAFT_587923 [Radiomyces spectabilis]KAI8366804.1 hypothetical protein BYT42DRAFT_587923 [Radiomyces spectabilis]
MTKRRLDDGELVNVLKQKQKEDPSLKAYYAQQTFQRLMQAQRPTNGSLSTSEPSYFFFNNAQAKTTPYAMNGAGPCYRCSRHPSSDRCAFCEQLICANCAQTCHSCQNQYCTTCSVIDYSSSMEAVFCLSCKNS